MKIGFRVVGTLEVPDDIILHEDVLNQLYALEMNDKMYMLQMCLVAESPQGEYEMVHMVEEMEEHNFKNVRYSDSEFFELN
jgi:hypothetical protein